MLNNMKKVKFGKREFIIVQNYSSYRESYNVYEVVGNNLIRRLSCGNVDYCIDGIVHFCEKKESCSTEIEE